LGGGFFLDKKNEKNAIFAALKHKNMRFVDIKNDVAFRKIFGNDKKTGALISFLNAVLELEGTSRVAKVVILNPYLLPRIRGEKASIIDVRATDQKGRKFVVEMQIAEKKGFDKRVQFYTAKDYSLQINQGEDYPLLKPTYFIGILDFNFGKGNDYHAKHLIIEQETGDNLLKDMKFAFIQLKKFKKKINELITPIDKWTFFFKNAKDLKFIPENVDDKGLKEAYDEAEKFNWDKDELIEYDKASIKVQDDRGEREFAFESGLDVGREEGKEIGREEGKEIGREEGIEIGMEQKEIAAVLGLHKNGVSASIIAVSLQISENRVLEIIFKNKK
jgi:predicted transposase/invertase (TIGR01784 family)